MRNTCVEASWSGFALHRHLESDAVRRAPSIMTAVTLVDLIPKTACAHNAGTIGLDYLRSLWYKLGGTLQ